MKTFTILSLVAGATATFKSANPFECPTNTDNKCKPKQAGGFNWGDLNPGKFDSYEDFNFKGWECKEDKSFARRGHFDRRTGGKVIDGRATSNKADCPSFQSKDKFSLDTFHLSTEFDCDLEFHYGMPDGSTCRHRAACKKGGNKVKNTQCGGAKDVTIVYPPQSNKPKKDCAVTVTSIDFDCSSHPPKTTTSIKTTSQPPKATTTSHPPKHTSESSKPHSQPPKETSQPPKETTSQPPKATTTSQPPQVTSPSSQPPKDTTSQPPKGTASTSVPPQGTASTSVPPQGTASTSQPPKGTASTSVPPQGTASTSVPPQGTASTSVPPQGTASTSVPPQGTASTSVPPQGTASTSQPPKDTASTSQPPAATTSITSTLTTIIPSTSTVFTTQVSTIISCAEGVKDCPGKSTTAVVTVSVPVSTTVTQITETKTTVLPPATTPNGPGVPATTPGAPATTPGAPGTTVNVPGTTVNVPGTTVTAPGPVVTLPCPEVVPKCLNTWIFQLGCKDNTDSNCYCPDTAFVENVFQCFYAHGESDKVISEAVVYFQGICAPHIPENPAIVTGPTITSYITVTAPPTPIATNPAAITTISVSQTTVVPVTDDAGQPIPSSSTTVTISTTVVVPKLGFTTAPPAPGATGPAGGSDNGGDIGLVPVTGAIPVVTGSAPGSGATRTPTGGNVSGAPAGTGVPPRPSTTGTVPVKAAGERVYASLALAVMAVVAAL